MSSPKFLLNGIGSRGDTNALMWLAAELVRRGHRCHLLATDSLVEQAAKDNVPLTVVGPPQTNNLVSPGQAYRDYTLPTYDRVFRFVRSELAAGERLVVINRSRLSPTTLCCEKYGLPQVRTYIAPSQVRSLISPAWPWKARTKGRLKATFRKYTLPRIYSALDTLPTLLDPLNEQRVRLGLPPLSSMAALDDRVDRFIGFFPDWYAKPAADWHDIDLVGFPVPRAKATLRPSLLRWIRERGRALVFTPGTGVQDVGRFFEIAAECCHQLGKPGIFLSPHVTSQSPGGNIRCFDYLPLESVLPHAELLVHHGGIGTTARALQAAVPQIILPRAYDQPDNGGRITDLRVGGVLSPATLSAQHLSAMVRSLLNDPSMRTRLSDVSSLMRDVSPISLAADLIETDYATGRGVAAGSPGNERAGRAGQLDFDHSSRTASRSSTLQ